MSKCSIFKIIDYKLILDLLQCQNKIFVSCIVKILLFPQPRYLPRKEESPKSERQVIEL